MKYLMWFSIGLLFAFFFAAQPYLFLFALSVSVLTGLRVDIAALSVILFVSIYTAVEFDFVAFSLFVIILPNFVRKHVSLFS